MFFEGRNFVICVAIGITKLYRLLQTRVLRLRNGRTLDEWYIEAARSVRAPHKPTAVGTHAELYDREATSRQGGQ